MTRKKSVIVDHMTLLWVINNMQSSLTKATAMKYEGEFFHAYFDPSNLLNIVMLVRVLN